jgi:dihydroorotate dehydrogenase electron transfer subunit
MKEQRAKGIWPARIAENSAIAQGVYRLVLAPAGDGWFDPAGARPGRFVNLYLPSADKLLPRPLSICQSEPDQLTLVYGVVGNGTKELSTYPPDTELRLSSPLGNGYDLSDVSSRDSALLIGGGLGVPPLLALTKALIDTGVSVTAVLGFRSEPFLTQDFVDLGANVLIATEDSSVGSKGTVMDTLSQMHLNADHWYACGPKPMLQEIAYYSQSIGIDAQLSMEERMGCGFGACLSCTCETRNDDGKKQRKKICKDGPVFWGREVFFHG